jgi:hypothetical protein
MLDNLQRLGIQMGPNAVPWLHPAHIMLQPHDDDLYILNEAVSNRSIDYSL